MDRQDKMATNGEQPQHQLHLQAKWACQGTWYLRQEISFPLKLTTYNLLSSESVRTKPYFKKLPSYPDRQKIQVEQLLALKSDIYVLQEFSLPEGQIILDYFAKAGYGYVIQEREHTHLNLTAYRQDRFTLIYQQAKKSRGLITVFQDENQHKVMVVNVHLDACSEIARSCQLASYRQVAFDYFTREVKVYCEVCERDLAPRNLSEHCQSNRHLERGGEELEIPTVKMPVIWAGDFNQTISEIGELGEALFHVDFGRTPSHWSNRQIDHIFFSPDCFQVEGQSVGFFSEIRQRERDFWTETNPSDHLPLSATFQLRTN